MLEFFVGLFIGCTGGIFLMSVFIVAGQNGKRESIIEESIELDEEIYRKDQL